MREYSISLLSAITSVSNIYFWLQAGYFDTDSHFMPLLHTWSLSVEEQFYFIWPAMLAALGTRNKLAIPIALGGLFTLSVAANFVFARIDQSAIFYLTPFRIFEFVIGAAVVWLERYRLPGAALAELLLVIGLLLIGCAVVFFTKDIRFPSANALIPCAGTALVIAFGRAKYTGALLRNRLAVGVGLISYSLYLVHWPIIVFYQYITVRPFDRIDKLVILVLSFALAASIYAFVEQPFRRRDSRFWQPRKQFLAACALLGALLMCTSATGLHGWEWRIPQAPHSDLSVYGGLDCQKPRCKHGDTGQPIYVIGESFARQLYDGLVTTFPHQRFVIFDHGHCTFFSPKWIQVQADGSPAACVSEREKLFQELRSKKPRVLFANNWVREKYFDADYFERTGGIRVKTVLTEEEKAEFTIAEIEKFSDSFGLDVLIVGNPPSIGSLPDLNVCLSRPIQLIRRDCEAAPISEVASRRTLALAAKGRVPIIDPFEAFCDPKRCRNYSLDGRYYYDKWHLSKLGSRFLIAYFKDALSEWMGEAALQASVRDAR
jgi:hypothetical protein